MPSGNVPTKDTCIPFLVPEGKKEIQIGNNKNFFTLMKESMKLLLLKEK